MSEFKGTVYLICFEKPYKGVRHYVGFATHLSKRVEHHKGGTGAKLLAAVKNAGIKFDVVRTFPGATREVERKIKNYKNTAAFCPNCFGDYKNKEISTPTNYVPPKLPSKRSYKSEITPDGLRVSEITIAPVELWRRLSARVRVGEFLFIGEKKYIRQNRRTAKNYFSEYYENEKIPGVEIIEREIAASCAIPETLRNTIFYDSAVPVDKFIVLPKDVERFASADPGGDGMDEYDHCNYCGCPSISLNYDRACIACERLQRDESGENDPGRIYDEEIPF